MIPWEIPGEIPGLIYVTTRQPKISSLPGCIEAYIRVKH